VVATTAISGEGVDDLLAAVRRHRAWLAEGGRRDARRAARLAAEVRHVAVARAGHTGAARCQGPAFDEVVARVVAGRLDPSSAADALLG
jgi:LAO/AO transport system kinase